MAIKEPYVKITEQIIDYPSVSNIDDSSLMAGVINAPIGPDHAIIQGPRQFLDTFTVDGTIPRDADITLINAYFCSFFAPMLLKRVWSYLSQQGSPLIASTLYDDGVVDYMVVNVEPGDLPCTDYSKLPFTDESCQLLMKYPINAIIKDAKPYPIINFSVTVSTIANWNSNVSKLFDSTEYKNISSEDAASEELAVVSWIGPASMTGYRLVSIKEDGVNPLTGQSIYYKDVLDSDSVPFIIEIDNYEYLDNEVVLRSTITNFTVGDDALYAYNPYETNVSGSGSFPSNKDYTDAWNWISESSDKYNISYISTLGRAVASEQKYVAGLADKNNWFLFWDVPYTSTTINLISSAAASEPDNYRFMVGGPFDWSSAVTSWRTYIAASSLYWQRVYNNKASNSEFAPVFDITNGTLAYQKPVKELTKTDRETLLSGTYPINWVKYDMTNRVYYLNDNRTHTRKQNVMNEEMNVRMMNKIARDIQLLLPRYKGMLNNEKTRLECKGLLESYMNQSIMSQNYRPVEYLIVCDESNNTPAVINANKLAVTVYIRLQGSIKYIEVLNKIYPLGVAFES